MRINSQPTIGLVLLLALLPATAASVTLLQSLSTLAKPLQSEWDLTPLVDAAGRGRVVLLGESSHGTHEFYAWRDRLSRRLIQEHGFSFIAIEGDWASLVPLDHYVRHRPGAASSARAALSRIEQWPRWIWSNTELAALGEWLHAFNANRPVAERIGIHGIDLYAVWTSLDAVLTFYQTYAPEAAADVQHRYRLLASFDGDSQAYAEYVRRTGHSAHAEVAWVARDLARRYRHASAVEREHLFEAWRHAEVVRAGENYLRLLPRPPAESWNLRAVHFERTLKDLLAHYGRGSRAIVWAHNTHIGDARATDMRDTGEVSLGQLARQRYGPDGVFAVGFGTAAGEVLAARRWGDRKETMTVPRPRPDSLEAALLATGRENRFMIFDRCSPATRTLQNWLPHRAIGVVFDPRRESWENYVPTRLSLRYDAFVFIPVTRPLEPLYVEPSHHPTRSRWINKSRASGIWIDPYRYPRVLDCYDGGCQRLLGIYGPVANNLTVSPTPRFRKVPSRRASSSSPAPGRSRGVQGSEYAKPQSDLYPGRQECHQVGHSGLFPRAMTKCGQVLCSFSVAKAYELNEAGFLCQTTERIVQLSAQSGLFQKAVMPGNGASEASGPNSVT